MSELKLGVLASGGGSNLQAIINASEEGSLGARVVLVISDNAGAYALERVKPHKIPALHINPTDFKDRDAYEERVLGELKNFGVQLVCLAGYMKLAGQVLLKAYPNKIMNIHPALLPAFPGLHAQAQAFRYGVRFSGCTVHFVDRGMDTGPIILQAVVPVLPWDTEETLADRILQEEHKIFPEAIRLFARGDLELRGNKVYIKDRGTVSD